jgi:hypothetical protein
MLLRRKSQKTNSLCLGESPLEGNPSHTPPPLRRLELGTPTRGETPNWVAKTPKRAARMRRRSGEEGGNSATFQIAQQWSNISRCFFHTEVCVSFPLLIAVSNCAHLLSACCKEESGILYSEAEPIKGPEPINRRRIWAPVLSRLHSILQATSLRRTVYTRTKSAKTTHVE